MRVAESMDASGAVTFVIATAAETHKSVKANAGNFCSNGAVSTAGVIFLLFHPEDFMRKLILAISALALATTAAFADVIADRKAVMKDNGKHVGVLVKMVQGETDFDAAAVLAALTALNNNVQAIDVAASFPPGSDKGDTTASPKIWEDMAGFQAEVDKFKAATAAAVAAPAQDLEALKPQVGAIGQSCSSCHEAYRIKKS